MRNIYVERFQKKLGCGAEITRFREITLEKDEDIKLMKNNYLKDRLWEEES